jgi:hypothetical protein
MGTSSLDCGLQIAECGTESAQNEQKQLIFSSTEIKKPRRYFHFCGNLTFVASVCNGKNGN